MRRLTALLALWLIESAAAWQSIARRHFAATISSFRSSSFSSRAPSSGSALKYHSFLIQRKPLVAATIQSLSGIDDPDDEILDPNLGPLLDYDHASSSNNNPEYYCRYWDALLTAEHAEAVEDLRERRRLWSRRRLQASGLALLGARCEADSAMINDKIVRITAPSSTTPIRFTRGEIVLITPTAIAGAGFRSSSVQQLRPREGCIVDVSQGWMTVAIGPTWLPGLYESRKQQSSRSFTKSGSYYMVRVDKAAPRAALIAQRSVLELVRKGQAGVACDLLVQSFGKQSMQVDHARLAEPPNRFQCMAVKERQGILVRALDRATTNSSASFRPNISQRDAILWALGRRVSLLQGPPGTGKTRTLACLVATALQLRDDPTAETTPPVSPNTTHSSKTVTPQSNNNSNSGRILAVAHSNGAADVLLQALLDLGIPAVRVGRPASVAASVRHRSILALAERHPEMVALRQSRAETETTMNQNLQEICRFIQQSAPVVVTSCIGAYQLIDHSNNHNNTQRPEFSLVVVDEAAQTTEPALLCALAAAQAEQLVLVGDTQQLPPTVASQDATLRAKLGISPMERLEQLALERRVFATQYRMPPALLEHPSRYFYDGRVTSAPGLQEAAMDIPLGFPWPSPEIPLAFVHCGSDLEVLHEFGGKSNPTEAKLVADIVAGLLHDQQTLNGSTSSAVSSVQEDIAVITPYSKQAQLIQNELVKHNIWEVRVGTVDSFQGQETGVVCFSAVRSNNIHELGFLRDPRRLCVSLTRGQRGLVVVGDADTLNGCHHWAAFLESCRSRKCVLDFKEYYMALNMRNANDAKNQQMAKDDSPLPSVQASVDNTTEKFIFEGISLFD